MLSDGRQSTHSPTGSYNYGTESRPSGHGYQTRSSITDDTLREDNEYAETGNDTDDRPKNDRPPQRSEDQYIAALRYRFPSRSKADYSYSKPPGPANPTAPPPPPANTQTSTRTSVEEGSSSGTAQRSGPYQSTIRPNTGGTNTSDISDGRPLPKPVLRRITPDQQNTYAKRIAEELDTQAAKTSNTSQSKPANTGLNVRINEPNTDTNRPIPSSSSFNTRQSAGIPKTQESIFESIHSPGGPVSYLGTGTFSQFEHCLRECLERERRQTGISSQIIRQDIPANISVLDPNLSSYYGHDPVRVHTFDDYPSRPTSTFSLDDIRYINAALSRGGIPLFPYYRSYPHSHSYPCTQRVTGDVVSACRVVDEDPAMLFSRNGNLAVQNVWNAIRNHQTHSSSRGPYDY